MVYICAECGRAFSRPWTTKEDHGEPRYRGEIRRVSPCCGEGFDEAVRCSGCGGWTSGGGACHGLCPSCAEGVVERLRGFLKGAFTPEEREVLNDAFDGVPLTE